MVQFDRKRKWEILMLFKSSVVDDSHLREIFLFKCELLVIYDILIILKFRVKDISGLHQCFPNKGNLAKQVTH